MLNFRNTSIAFGLLLNGLIIYNFSHEVPAWIYLSLFFTLSLVIFYGSYFIRANFFLKAFNNGAPDKNEIAITFDDGPHDNTPAILEMLNRYHVKASFFCIGKNIQGREEILKNLSAQGQIIGNHSYSHSNYFDFFSVAKLMDDVSKTDELIYQSTGKRNRLFRPPFGVTTPNIAKMVRKKKYDVIGWNVRSFDTVIKDKEKLLHRIFSMMKNGSVILLHDSTPGIAGILEQIILHANMQKLEIVSIEKLFHINANEPY